MWFVPRLPGSRAALLVPLMLVASVAASGGQVRFCINFFPVTEDQRRNDVGCVTSKLPP